MSLKRVQEDELINSNKKARTVNKQTDNKQTDNKQTDNNIQNMMDKYPFILRSINACMYMESNPILFDYEHIIPINIFNIYLFYILDVFQRFYGNCGFNYINDKITINNDGIEIFILIPIPEYEIEFNFSIFIESLRKTLMTNLLTIGLNNYEVEVKSEMNGIIININIVSSNEMNRFLKQRERELTRFLQLPEYGSTYI